MLFVLAVLAGLACAGIIGLQWTAYRARRATEGLLAALAEQGLYVEPARAENGPQTMKDPAPAAEKAGVEATPEEIPFESFALQTEAPADISEYTDCMCSPDLPAWDTMSEAMRVAMRQYLADNQDTLRKLHDNGLRWRTAMAWDTSVGDIERSEIQIKTLSKAIRLLQIEAHVAMADRDGDTAATALDAALVLVKQSARIASMNKIGRRGSFVLSIAYSIRDTISSGVMESEHLASLQQGISALRKEDMLRQELRNQLNWGLAFFREPERMQYVGRTPVDRFVPGFDQLLISATQRSGLFEIQRPQYLRSLHQLAEIVDRPAPERFQQLKRMMEESLESPALLQGLASDLARDAMIGFTEVARIEADIACVSTALALERYRLEQGSLPDTLDALAPVYLPELPKYPFDDGRLRYVPRDDGFTLYGVGLDGIDNGGVFKESDDSFWDWFNGNNVIFTVRYRPNTPGIAAETGVQPDSAGASERR
jgi:hypothetical protein